MIIEPWWRRAGLRRCCSTTATLRPLRRRARRQAPRLHQAGADLDRSVKPLSAPTTELSDLLARTPRRRQRATYRSQPAQAIPGRRPARFDEEYRGDRHCGGPRRSSAYRYYPSKAALLAVAFHRASDRLLMAITDALAESSSPRQAALRIAERYTALAFAAPELVNIYFAEFANLPEADQAELRRLQRQNVDEWAHLVSQVGARETEALFRVHAALALVVDIGRLVNFDSRGEQRMRVQALMAAVLFGDGRGYAQDGALATIDR